MGPAVSTMVISTIVPLGLAAVGRQFTDSRLNSLERQVALQAEIDLQNAQAAAERARRNADEAAIRATRDSAALAEAQRLENEVRQRELLLQQATEEAERRARAWEQIAAEAESERQAAERARLEAEERLMRGIPPDERPTVEDLQRFRQEYGYKTGSLNIALTGESGVGKSALLNAVRGLFHDDPGAAAVGFNETTAVIQSYVDPHQSHVRWFDIPGANTPNISGWRYFINQHLYIFDFLVVIFSDRLTQTTGTILSNAQKCGIPTVLVRSKADQLVRNIMQDKRNVDKETATRMLIEETTNTVNANLEKLGLPIQPAYIVSVDGMRQWVNERNELNVIDDKKIYQLLFPASLN